MGKIIEVNRLSKSYKNINTINGIDFYVESDSLFTFLGVNGTGKSTTFRYI